MAFAAASTFRAEAPLPSFTVPSVMPFPQELGGRVVLRRGPGKLEESERAPLRPELQRGFARELRGHPHGAGHERVGEPALLRAQ